MRDKFIQALKNNDLSLLQQVPKSDLHNHGARGGNIEYLEKWAGVKIQRNRSKFATLDDMQDWYVKNVKSICLGTEGYEIRIEAAFAQARQDGVKVLNMSVGYEDCIFYNNSVEEWLDALKRIHIRTAPEVRFVPELAFGKGTSVDRTIEMFDAVIDYGFFKSMDLHGDELPYPCTDYRRLYRKAKDKGLVLKAHVGEFGDAQSIREAVEVLELDQVQHGVSAANSRNVMKWLSDNKIQLNVCPTSNVMLYVSKDYKSHPIKELYDNGIRVTINTDDALIFDQGVSQEFLNLYNAGLFTPEELNDIRENGLTGI